MISKLAVVGILLAGTAYGQSVGIQQNGKNSVATGNTVVIQKPKHDSRSLMLVTLAVASKVCEGHPERSAWVFQEDWKELDCAKFIKSGLGELVKSDIEIFLLTEDVRLSTATKEDKK